VAAMPTEPAPEAATRLRVDPAALMREAVALFGGDSRAAAALLDRIEASASAEDGDIVAEAEILWAR
jgi:hypothetical protein